ncbi:MAG: helix-turn-helix transcriptional regulator [Nitratireductor sp.]|nr:helix-turn-helix transcriptional regulator [Nitratireductor sp.]
MTTSRKPDEGDKQRGRELARMRKAQSLSQAEMAAKIGVSTQQYGKYERGENRIPIGRYQTALSILGAVNGSLPGFSESAAGYEVAPLVKAELQQLLDELKGDLDKARDLLRRL